MWLIEDACEAHGAKYYQKYVGSFGDLSTFSFFASHHITTMEGGMVLTSNKTLYELGKSLRTFGWVRDLSSRKTLGKKYQKIDPRFLFVNMGYNFRPTELQGAFGIHQIKKLENLVKIRIENATFWNKKLSPYEEFLILPKLKKHYRKSFLFYPLTVIKNNYFSKQELVNYFGTHMDVNAVVYCGNNKKHTKSIQENAALNVKRVVLRKNIDWDSDDGQSPYMILDNQEIKTVWHPIGI